MEIVTRPTARLHLLRYASATLLTLFSAVCLTLAYEHEGSFVRILRIAVGWGLPWIVAWLVTSKRSYWLRLVFCYISVVATGVIVMLIWPIVELVLMDAGAI